MHIFENAGKSPQRRGHRPQIPIGLWQLRDPPPDPRVAAPVYWYSQWCGSSKIFFASTSSSV